MIDRRINFSELDDDADALPPPHLLIDREEEARYEGSANPMTMEKLSMEALPIAAVNYVVGNANVPSSPDSQLLHGNQTLPVTYTNSSWPDERWQCKPLELKRRLVAWARTWYNKNNLVSGQLMLISEDVHRCQFS
ncbi:unnamed protein product [Spirodela intermedia]|uniref:Uncharacterized protein n=2 Tax=Spirodela intermedia TaxID=51605 RepID=A0A7I8KXE5_SPIIN|nr:unnamed protein product [Spirodela intermedia]CAA6665024.1 unnamed protein product [Spirodela intermedia]CAA7401665.1 unnamed protein product [Spirodela intermedia]